MTLSIGRGEQTAIIGANASGKSHLVDMLTGQWPLRQGKQEYDFTPSPHKLVSQNVKYISFRDAYGEADSTYYMQQRWNQHDIDVETPTVGELLQSAVDATRAGADAQAWQAGRQERLVKLFGLERMLDKYVITLSSGELRKLQLTRTLLSAPRVLVMDNPFIGLDAETRDSLRHLLAMLAREEQMQVVIVVSRVSDIPDFFTHVIAVTPRGEVQPKMEWHNTEADREAVAEAAGLQFSTPVLSAEAAKWLRQAAVSAHNSGKASSDAIDTSGNGASEVLAFHDVTIRYGERTILSNLNWTVRQGERWALTGPNGSGKSTLLSLVCADNPQGYACDISLFGRKRGTGESIWDIKRHIGYVSPEMHRAYLRDLPAMDIVASGLRDSIGLYHRPTPAERSQCMAWMQVFGLANLADRTFMHLSSGEQRLCLVARAFVKNPDLLILDEPLHGLDERRRQLVREVIETYCTQPGKTLIMVTHYPEDLPSSINRKLTLERH